MKIKPFFYSFVKTEDNYFNLTNFFLIKIILRRIITETLFRVIFVPFGHSTPSSSATVSKTMSGQYRYYKEQGSLAFFISLVVSCSRNAAAVRDFFCGTWMAWSGNHQPYIQSFSLVVICIYSSDKDRSYNYQSE